MTSKSVLSVIGTQNTGKTTFIKDLLEFYSSDSNILPLQKNTVDYRTKISQEGLSINRNGNLRCQKIIFECLSDSVIQAINDRSISNFISDRSVIDAYVYTLYLHKHQKEKNITENDISEMYSRLRYFVRLYDLFVYIPLKACSQIEVVDDKFRDTNLEYREEIDSLFFETIEKLKNDLAGQCPLIVSCHSQSREDRVRWFDNMFRNLLVEKTT